MNSTKKILKQRTLAHYHGMVDYSLKEYDKDNKYIPEPPALLTDEGPNREALRQDLWGIKPKQRRAALYHPKTQVKAKKH